jgi:hypothetical protein
MTKLETMQCNICEGIRPPRFAGQQWFEIYWVEKQAVVLHVCDGCRCIMGRLLVGLGFQVETPSTIGPDIKAIDRIAISGFYGAANDHQMHPALSRILREAREGSQ